MMNHSPQDKLLNKRAKTPSADPLAQAWGRPFQARQNAAPCACGGDCPRCQATKGQNTLGVSEAAASTGPANATPQRETRTTTHPFKVEIQAAPPGQFSASSQGKASHDSGQTDEPVQAPADTRSEEITANPPEAETTAPSTGPDDDVLYIPQMEGPDGEKHTQSPDAIGASFNYAPTTSQGGVTMGANDFGMTSGSIKHFSNVRIRRDAGNFTVTADLKQSVAWDTRATVGPNGEVNIMGATDPALTNANYAQVVSDLTPNLADLKGRPPRTKFWSKDFTIKHEKYHVKDYVDIGQVGATGAETWLAGQTASSKREVRSLLRTAWSDQVFKVWDKFTDPPKVEERAYDDGAASYTARANAIKTKGDKGPAGGGYP